MMKRYVDYLRRGLDGPHPVGRRLPRLAQPRRPDAGGRARHRVRRQEHARVRADGGGDRADRGRRGVPGALRGDPGGLPGGVHRRRRHRQGRQPDRLHPHDHQRPRAGRPARRGDRPVRRDARAARLAPVDRLPRGRRAAAGAHAGRSHRHRLPAAAERGLPVVGLRDRQGRDHDLGALELDHAGRQLRPGGHELVQPLRLRRGRRVDVPDAGGRLRARAGLQEDPDRAAAG